MRQAPIFGLTHPPGNRREMLQLGELNPARAACEESVFPGDRNAQIGRNRIRPEETVRPDQ